MAIERTYLEIESLVGGLDTFINATEIDDSATPDCLDVVPTGKSAFKTRLGRTAHGGEITNGYSGQGYFTYVNTSNTLEELVVVNGVLLKKNGESWDTISGGTLSTSARVCAVQLGDRLYFADGETALCYYDGTNIVTTGVADAPLPSILISFGRRLYANDANNPDRWYFGGGLTSTGGADNTGNFASTTPAFGGYYGHGKGKTVTSLAKLGANYLVIGTKDAIYRGAAVSDTGASDALDHSVELISNSVGISTHFAVDNMENDLIIPSWEDIYLLGEVASYSAWRTRVISTKVSGDIKGITDSMVQKVAGIYSPAKKKYYYAYADGTAYNNKVLVYDSYYKSWWKFSNWHAAAWAEFVSSSTNYLNYVSDNPSDSYCYEVDTGADDDGTVISWYWKSKVFDLKSFDWPKKFKRWASLFGPVFGTISVSIFIDGVETISSLTIGTPTTASTGCGTKVMGQFILGQETNDTGSAVDNPNNDYRWRKIPRPNEGTQIQFKFSGGGANQSGQIEKIRIYYNLNQRKKDRTKRIT